MAKVFLDTNCFIDSIHRKPEKEILSSLEYHIAYVSPLSLHIYCYIFKVEIPNAKVTTQIGNFQMVGFSRYIADKTLAGPTEDFEDNVQLHSAAESECDLFVTQDKKLLDMKFFGKTQVISLENL